MRHKYYLLLGLIGFGTFLYDFQRNLWQLVNYLSTFTAIIVATSSLFFIYLGISKKNKLLRIKIDLIRAAFVCYLLATATIYQIFLASQFDPNRIFWIDFVMHRILPAGSFLGWILFPTKSKVSYGFVLNFAIFPIIYFIYILVRGSIIGWYPYYFFDPTKSNYISVILFAAELTVAGLVGSLVVIAIGNCLNGKQNNKVDN